MEAPTPHQVHYEDRRRLRAQLSCNYCRLKKLRCNRGHPCDNCLKRNLGDSCQYPDVTVRRTAQARRVTGSGDIVNRVRHLEHLILSLRSSNSGQHSELQSQQRPSTKSLPTGAALLDDAGEQPQSTAPNSASISLEKEPSAAEEASITSTGTMIAYQMGTRWVDSSHWQAILDDLTELRGCTELLDHQRNHFVTDDDEEQTDGPALFLAGSPLITRSGILTFLPPRIVVDRLVARYFNSKDTSLVALHVPTFYKQYMHFWENQETVSVTWIGLLFTILCHSLSFYRRAGDTPPGSLGNTAEVGDSFRIQAAHCLVLGNYTNPGEFKVETLLLYSGTEFLRTTDMQIGASMLLSLIIRLAIHTGYHRDSKSFPNISIRDGEMRRRVWALIWQMDHLVSFQVGIPRIINDAQCDTELPRNLNDEDLDEKTAVLPQSRPMNERTPVTYTIIKSKLISVFGRVVEKSYTAKGGIRETYEDIMNLDEHLQNVHDSLPDFLRIRPISMSIMDPPDLIMQRYNLELLYQKTRCVLHRRYLTIERINMRYAYSRWSCVDAARQMLQHQHDIYYETLPGGQLHRDRWFVTSLTSHDFLLAAMILCLDLSSKVGNEPQNSLPEGANRTYGGRKDLLHALETSKNVWAACGDSSFEASKASEALAIILQNARKAIDLNARDNTNDHIVDESLDFSSIDLFDFNGCVSLADPAVQSFVPNEDVTEGNSQQIAIPSADKQPMHIFLNEMMDNLEEFNWNTWDRLQHGNWNTTEDALTAKQPS